MMGYLLDDVERVSDLPLAADEVAIIVRMLHQGIRNRQYLVLRQLFQNWDPCQERLMLRTPGCGGRLEDDLTRDRNRWARKHPYSSSLLGERLQWRRNMGR